MMKSSRKHGLLLAAACLLPVAAHAQDTLPPGFDVKQYRASMIASNVQMCTATSQIYPELNNNAPLKKKFCQCVYENYYTRSSDAELKREIEEAIKMLDAGLDKIASGTGDREKARRKAAQVKQNLAADETQCMTQLKVSVTPVAPIQDSE